jgi:hypothetical protein
MPMMFRRAAAWATAARLEAARLVGKVPALIAAPAGMPFIAVIVVMTVTVPAVGVVVVVMMTMLVVIVTVGFHLPEPPCR